MAETATVFKISVDSAQAVQAIAEYSRKIEELKNEEKALREEIKKSGTTTDEQAKALVRISEQRKAYATAMRESSKEIQNNMRQSQAEVDSLKSLRAQLSNLTKKYDEMSKARRESTEGWKLQDEINEVTDALKAAEEGTQRYYRNVGNYENSLSGLFGTTAVNAGQTVVNIKNMVVASGGVIPAFKAMGAAATTALGPIGIIVMAVVAVFKLLKDAVNSSEESSHEASEAFSFIKGIFEQVKKVIQTVVGWILKFVNVIIDFHKKTMEVLSNVLRWVGFEKISDAMDEYAEKQRRVNELIREQNQLVKDARALNEKNAERELELAKLRDNATNKLTYTARQRLAFLKEAHAKEKAMSEENYLLAKREYENLKGFSELSENDAATNDKLSQAYVKMVQAQTAFFNKSKELNAQMAEASNQIIAEQKAILQKQKEIREAELADIEAAIDAMLDLYEDGYVKETALANAQYRRQKAALQKRLREEENLTTKQVKAINEQIVALTIAHEKEITRIKEQAAQERQNMLASAEEQWQDMQLNLMGEGVDAQLQAEEVRYAREKKQMQVEYDERVAKIKQNIKTWNDALKGAEGSERDEITSNIEAEEKALKELTDYYNGENGLFAAAEEYHELRLEAITSENTARVLKMAADDESLKWQNKIKEAELQNGNFLQLQLEWKQHELDTLHQLEEESDAEFYARQLKAKEEVLKAARAIKEAEWADFDKEIGKYEAMGNAIGALGQIVEQFGEDNRAAAIASKAIAIGEIAVQTGVAIAKGVSAAAAAGPFPANLAAILTTVATVLANVATATNLVKSAKFSTGGYVSGEGTGTSDSISARLSNGESVNNARSTSMFSPIYSALNQMGGGIPIIAAQSAAQVQGEDMLARAFAKGMKEANIRVGVDEITRVQNRVKVVERMGVL